MIKCCDLIISVCVYIYIYNCIPSHLYWALNEIKIRYNDIFALASNCNHLSIDGKGYIDTILSNLGVNSAN